VLARNVADLVHAAPLDPEVYPIKQNLRDRGRRHGAAHLDERNRVRAMARPAAGAAS